MGWGEQEPRIGRWIRCLGYAAVTDCLTNLKSEKEKSKGG